EGGWQTVADKLRELAVQAGAVIATGRKTEQIAVGSGKVRSIVLSDGTPVEVSAVIAAVGPDEACRMVEGSEHMSLGSWKAQSRPIYAACLDVALRCVPRPEHLFAVGMDQPLYYSNHSASVTLSDNGSYV
ncbi:NAD(P)/FAD-dependent oxidoreductase, partial [Paenibacillus sepulcri]|nr:NAD(P)/FAD-dependent oxidoreductase [Paenibacillus sepulcri]